MLGPAVWTSQTGGDHLSTVMVNTREGRGKFNREGGSSGRSRFASRWTDNAPCLDITKESDSALLELSP
jgi:hypothetical protein